MSFFGQGRWYKGNLHCHSTVSDGLLKPSEVVSLYKKRGWDFLAFTEHNIYSDWESLSDETFLVLPGVELDTACVPNRCHHVVGIRRENYQRQVEEERRHFAPGKEGLQEVVDTLNLDGHISIYCHPIWSRVEFADIEDLLGVHAMEIFNYGSELESHSGLCLHYWDSLLRKGRRILGVATDDAHHRIGDQCGGWIMVKADKLTLPQITESILAGQFYSSSGPTLLDFGREGNTLYVECSPVQSIHFVAYERPGESFHAAPLERLTSARYTLRGNEAFVRVEIVDLYGKTAWSNPVFF